MLLKYISFLYEKIENFSIFLGKMPSFFYGMIYLLAIPIFAVIYMQMPLSFYHSTIKEENNTDMQRKEILKEFREEVRLYCSNNDKYNKIFKDMPFFFFLDSCDVNFDLDCAFFKVTFPKFKRANESEVLFETKYDKQYNCFSKEAIISIFMGLKYPYALLNPISNGCNSRVIWLLCEEKNGDLEILDLFFPEIPVYQKEMSKDLYSSNVRCFPLSKELLAKIIAFGYAMKGFPSESKGSLERMFYLSAVTITTLGFGDIVPITKSARIVISIEAILGVVLVGLFFNSLAKEIGKK